MMYNILSSTDAGNNNPMSWVFLAVIAVAFIVIFILNSRSQKKRQKEMEETLDAVKPGCKVKTIGGICGIVVEVCKDDNTFILETGSEASGKCYLKFDRQAIYQTDAKKEEAPAEQPKEEVKEDKEEN